MFVVKIIWNAYLNIYGMCDILQLMNGLSSYLFVLTKIKYSH